MTTETLRALLALTGHVAAPRHALCRRCPEDQLRLELAGLSLGRPVPRDRGMVGDERFELPTSSM